MSLFSRKAYGKLITMTGKKGGMPVLVGELEPIFRVHEGALNDAINYAPKGCAMQM